MVSCVEREKKNDKKNSHSLSHTYIHPRHNCKHQWAVWKQRTLPRHHPLLPPLPRNLLSRWMDETVGKNKKKVKQGTKRTKGRIKSGSRQVLAFPQTHRFPLDSSHFIKSWRRAECLLYLLGGSWGLWTGGRFWLSGWSFGGLLLHCGRCRRRCHLTFCLRLLGFGLLGRRH